MLHGEVKVNDLTLLRWQADNVHNTRTTPIVYEVTATGLDTGQRPFYYEFQVLAGEGYTGLVTQILAEVAERCDRDSGIRVDAAAGTAST